MIHVQLKSIGVQNVGPIKDIKMDIGSGTTLIRGHNQDAKTGGRQTNAVGKSLACSPIALGFTGTRPMLAPKRYQRSGMFQTPGACLTLGLTINGLDYELIQRQKGSGYELQINKQGKNMGLRTLKIAEAVRQELIPMSEEQFYSTVYLDMKRPSVIQAGTDVQRLEFICRLFDLNHFDTYRKRLLVRQQDLVSRRQEQKTLARELMDVQRRQDQLKWGPRAEARYQELKIEQQELTEQLTKLAQQLDVNAKGQEQRKARKQAKKELLPAGHPTVRELRQQIEDAQMIEDQQRLFRNMQRQKKKMVKLLGQKLPPKPKERIEDLEKAVNRLRHQYRPVLVPVPVVKPAGRLLTRSEYTKYMALTDLNEQELSSDCCPTCGHKIGNLAKKVKKAKKLVKTHHRLLLWRENEHNRQQALIHQEKMDKLVAEGKVAAERLNIARKYEAQKGLRLAIKKVDRDFSDPPQLKGGLGSKELRTQLEAVRRSIAAAKVLAEPLVPVYPKALSRHETKTNRLTVVSSQLSDLHTRRSEHRANEKTIKSLSTKLGRFENLEVEEQALNALLKLLSNKGLKVDAVNAVLQELEHRMNQHAELLFVEPIEFKFSAKPGRVSLLYRHRKASKARKHLWADIRELSGQESRAFSLLFFCQVRPLLPTVQTDFVVLDEMDANMSQPTRDLFAKEFLPYLQTVIPKIIIATPDNNTAYSGRIISLVKKDGVTRLEGQKASVIKTLDPGSSEDDTGINLTAAAAAGRKAKKDKKAKKAKKDKKSRKTGRVGVKGGLKKSRTLATSTGAKSTNSRRRKSG
jgi:DNA repair exonuclease SbcCD ATPase subunit